MAPERRHVRTTQPPLPTEVEQALARAQAHLLGRQHPDGYWVYPLESGPSITAEYSLLLRQLDQVEPDKEQRAVRYLLRSQLPEGGWPIFYDGGGELSTTVKVYFALKLAGLSPLSQPLRRAREFIQVHGGLERVSVFTKITLAQFGQYPWSGIPSMPAELILLPRDAFFRSVSYWSRTVIIPLLVIFACRPVWKVPAGLGLEELAPERFWQEGPRPEAASLLGWKRFFLGLDRVIKWLERVALDREGNPLRPLALRRAERWIVARLGRGGLGGIYPAMANAVVALRCLGYPADHPMVREALRELSLLEVSDGDELWVQPCLSPVWDTSLAMNALIETGLPPDNPVLLRAAEWLLGKQTRQAGDWMARSRVREPGGWYFQFFNEWYPDTDDTAVVLMALRKLRPPTGFRERLEPAMERGLAWLLGMQSRDGGWGAYDVDNNRAFLNQIPFADHGALLDPSTEDLAGRALEAMGEFGYDLNFPPARRALAFLRRTQRPSGAWYGRWGGNYIYGTWSVLRGLAAIGLPREDPAVRRAAAWLKACQNPDGGWGERCESYMDPTLAGTGPSCPSQTAWALLGLMAAGEVEDPAVARGVRSLLDTQAADGSWTEPFYTGTGFPRVFYLRYHGYAMLFALWALARYQRLRSGPTGAA